MVLTPIPFSHRTLHGRLLFRKSATLAFQISQRALCTALCLPCLWALAAMPVEHVGGRALAEVLVENVGGRALAVVPVVAVVPVDVGGGALAVVPVELPWPQCLSWP